LVLLDLAHEVIFIFFECAHLVRNNLVRLVDFVLCVLDVLLVLLNAVDVEQVVLFKRHELLVQLVCFLEEKSVLVKPVRQLYQV